MNAPTLKRRIFAIVLAFLLATQSFAPGATAQVLADEIVGPGDPVVTVGETPAADPDQVQGDEGAPGGTAAVSEAADPAPDPAVEPTTAQAPAATQAQPAAEAREAAVPVTRANGETDYGGLTISGGTAGVDYALETVAYTRIGRGNNESLQRQDGRTFVTSGSDTQDIPMLVIKESGTYTIRNAAGVGTAVSTGIRVAPGVYADITFAGVNIDGRFPMDIATNSTVSGNETTEVSEADVADKTYVHITLADGTVNTLYNHYYTTKDPGTNTTAAYQFPGLRCGEGSVLVIDDAVRNVDTSGTPITPVQGAIPAGTTYVAKDGTTKTSTGKGSDLASSLSNLESSNPGTLWVYSGIRSAAIGGGPVENSGDMTFNGGDIHAYAQDPGAVGGNPSGNGSGCGIGGGHAGGGTTTTFNGGTVDAQASYHGAAIGGGCTYTGGMSTSAVSYPLRDALISRTANHTIAGDITINGGYVKAQGYYHSNAFGQGCGGTNAGKTILITGGTLEPSWGGNPSFLEIGGNQGYVVITGGSVKCTPGRFQGNANDGLAYGDLAHTTKVGMMTVNVAPKIQSMAAQAGVTPNLNAALESWELLLDKFPTDPAYGAPASFLEGKLYLWLPTGTNADHQIDANFHYYVGDTLLSSNTTLPAGSSTGGDTIAKEWERFTLDTDFVEQNWSKYYDGEPLTPVDVEANPIPVGNPAGGQLNENKTLKYNFQQVDEDGAALSAAVTGTATPSDAGFYDIEVRSEQYKQNTAFSQTYWGHSATGRAVIRPVCSATTAEVEQGVTLSYTDADGNVQLKTYTAPTWAQDDNAGNFNSATNNHLVVPVDVASDVLPDGSGTMSSTKCKAPTGRLQLYIDGRKVGAAHGGVIELTRAAMDDAADASQWVRTDADGREHSMAYFNLTRSQLEAFGLEDRSGEGNEHTVSVEYTSASEDAAPRDEDVDAGDEGDDPAAQVLAAFRRVFSAPFTPAHNDSAYVNYYESDTGEATVQIDLATPDFRLFNEQGTGYVPNGEGLADGQQAANDAKVMTDEAHERDYAVKVGDAEERRGLRDDLEVKDFRDETDDDGNVTATHDDWFPLYVLTNSIGDIEFTSSNPSVIAIEPNAHTTDRAYVENKTDYGVGAKARVVSAGRTTITATLKGTGAFSGATRSFDVYVFPDLAKKPVLAIDQNTYDATREDGTVRPGDTLRTVVDVTNTTPDSACIDPVITVSVPTDTVFKRLVAIDPDGNETDLTDAVKDKVRDGVVTVDTLPTLFGGQTYRLKMDVEVQPSLISNESPDLASRSTADGIYGVNKDQFEWDTRLDRDGNPVDEVSASADPTLPDPSAPEDPEKRVEDVLGGTLEDPEPSDPDDPSGDPDKPGVPVTGVTPGSPLDGAKDPRPADPSDPDAPVSPDPDRPRPVLPGDRIVEFGDRKEPDTPKTPEDIAKEVEEQIRKRLEEDPEATEVDIPVTVERYDPSDPDKDPERIEVVVTIPIPHDDPDDRDDHDLVVVPSDPDTSAGDIEVSKTWANVTEGADRRANTEIVQVGDELLYTVTVTNTKAGSAYYGSVVADELPVGVEYVPGSIEVVCGDGTKAGKDDFKADYNAASRRIYIAAGHLHGGQTATVTFRCRVTADRLDYDEPQDLVNVARAFGTLPSDTVKDPDPDDPDDPAVPDGPKEVVIPDGTPGPFGDENPPADPVDDERGPEEPADLELFYTVRVRKVEAADDTPAADTVATRAQLLDTLRALAAADGYDLSADPDTLDLEAAHGVTLSRTAATGAEATALTETGTSTLTATFSGANGSTVRATLTHIVWDEDSPEEDRPKPGPEGGPEFLPEEQTFRASAAVSEKVGEGSLSQQELFERALALAQGRGLRLPAGVQRDRFTLVRQDAEGNWEELGPNEAVDLSKPASYRFTADYSREGTADTGAMSGPVTLGYSLFTSSVPTSEEKGGTSGPVAPQNPDPEDIEVTKTSTNTTPHEDGQVHVGDLLAYEISVANTGAPSTCLYDVVVSDELPEGLEVVSGSLAMVLPGGAEKEVPDSVYDPLTHSLSVYGGYLKGGETLVLRFSARVGEAAEGTDIGNHAVASYVDPSDSTTETIFGLEPRPEPGEPARSSDFPHSRVLDPTPAAYPDDATGPVLPAEATLPSTGGGTLKPLPVPARGLVRAVVPVTGDTGPMAGLAALVAGALAATAAVLRRRRTEA